MYQTVKESPRVSREERFQIGPSFFPIFAHPGFSGFKIINPGIPGLFRDLFLLNKTFEAVFFQVILVSYFCHIFTKHDF